EAGFFGSEGHQVALHGGLGGGEAFLAIGVPYLLQEVANDGVIAAAVAVSGGMDPDFAHVPGEEIVEGEPVVDQVAPDLPLGAHDLYDPRDILGKAAHAEGRCGSVGK